MDVGDHMAVVGICKVNMPLAALDLLERDLVAAVHLADGARAGHRLGEASVEHDGSLLEAEGSPFLKRLRAGQEADVVWKELAPMSFHHIVTSDTM